MSSKDEKPVASRTRSKAQGIDASALISKGIMTEGKGARGQVFFEFSFCITNPPPDVKHPDPDCNTEEFERALRDYFHKELCHPHWTEPSRDKLREMLAPFINTLADEGDETWPGITCEMNYERAIAVRDIGPYDEGDKIGYATFNWKTHVLTVFRMRSIVDV